MTTYYSLHNSPTGELLMMSDGKALTDLHMTAGKYVPEAHKDWVRDDAMPVFALARKEHAGSNARPAGVPQLDVLPPPRGEPEVVRLVRREAHHRPCTPPPQTT